MKTKLILDMTGLRVSDKLDNMMMVQLALLAMGFTWPDGSQEPKALDGDALVINHPKNESVRHLVVYKFGRFDREAHQKAHADQDIQVFDATDIRQFALFLDGVKFLMGLHGKARVEAGEDEGEFAGVYSDHKDRPLGWSGRDTPDPVWTEMFGKIKISVCKHVAVTSSTRKGDWTPEELSAIENRIREINREKFGFESKPYRVA
jgi:hypothetical protein